MLDISAPARQTFRDSREKETVDPGGLGRPFPLGVATSGCRHPGKESPDAARWMPVGGHPVVASLGVELRRCLDVGRFYFATHDTCQEGDRGDGDDVGPEGKREVVGCFGERDDRCPGRRQ